MFDAIENDLRRKRWKELGLSTRAANALLNDEIYTIEDLQKYPIDRLKRMPNFGRKSLEEVQCLLLGAGRQLDPHSPCEKAWRAYRGSIAGALTRRDEFLIERAFKAGWFTRDAH